MKKYLADDKNIRPLGRTLFFNDIRYIDWCCSGVEFIFTGTEICAEIWTDWTLDEPWKGIFQAYYAVFINDEEIPSRRFGIAAGTKNYEIFKSSRPETVKIRIIKLSEGAFSKTGIKSISSDGKIVPTKPLTRKIEFIGDSITCGFGIEGKNADEGFRTETENSAVNYASLTARHFGADHSLISWSSIGVCSSWSDDGNINNGWVMPKIYGYTDLGLEGIIGIKEHIEWDFERSPSDVIVVNLGTNDVSYTKDIPERLSEFERVYGEFITDIRRKNPDAYIICALGMMGDELFPQISNAAASMNDPKIYTLRFDIQKEEDGTGSEKHPNSVTHKKAAEKLSEKISEITGWK